MNIIGSGIDLVEVGRFERTLKRWGSRLIERLFTPEEFDYVKKRKRSAQHLAVRFAAKEAVVKALGAPKGLGLKWRDLEIKNDSSGRPRAIFHRTLSRWADCEVHLSLTHTASTAAASALVLEGPSSAVSEGV